MRQIDISQDRRDPRGERESSDPGAERALAEERDHQGQHSVRVGLQEGGLRGRHRRLRSAGGLQATPLKRSGAEINSMLTSRHDI